MRNNTAITLIILSLGLFYTFSNAQYKEVKHLTSLKGDYQDALQKVADIVAVRRTLLADYDTVPKEYIESLNKVLPDNVNNVRMALDLDATAGRYGISIQNIQVVADLGSGVSEVALSESNEPYEKVTVAIAFVAKHESFMSFLADLEKNLRVMDIKAVTFRTGVSDLYEYQVSVDTYWLK